MPPRRVRREAAAAILGINADVTFARYARTRDDFPQPDEDGTYAVKELNAWRKAAQHSDRFHSPRVNAPTAAKLLGITADEFAALDAEARANGGFISGVRFPAGQGPPGGRVYAVAGLKAYMTPDGPRTDIHGVADLLGVSRETAAKYAFKVYAEGVPGAVEPFFPAADDGMWSREAVREWSETRLGGGAKGKARARTLQECEECGDMVARRWRDPESATPEKPLGDLLCKPDLRARQKERREAK